MGWKRCLCLFILVGLLSCRSPLSLEAPSGESIATALRQLAYQWASFRSGAVLTADILADGIAIPLQCRVEVAGTDSVRVDLWGLLGLPVGQFWATAEQFQYYDAVRNILFQGPWRVDLVARFLGVRLSFEHFVALLLQRPPIPDSLYRVLWDSRTRLLYVADERGQVILQLPTWEPVAYEYWSSPDTLRMLFAEWTMHPVAYARQLRLETPHGSLRLRIRSYSLRESRSVPLSLNVPEDAERVVVE